MPFPFESTPPRTADPQEHLSALFQEILQNTRVSEQELEAAIIGLAQHTNFDAETPLVTFAKALAARVSR